MSIKNLLLIEDDFDIQEMLQFFLKEQGYEITIAGDGVEGVAEFLKNKYDLVLLDILLPKMDGYAVCELIRKESEVPIIMISALGSEEDQVKGFDLNIDDYIPKPISMPIMVRKIEAVLRRYDRDKEKSNGVIIYKDLELDIDNQRAYVKEKVIELTKKEYEILNELLENQGKIVSRESFLNRLWKYEFYGDERAVDNHIKNLRRKLVGVGEYIETIRGAGYRIDKIH